MGWAGGGCEPWPWSTGNGPTRAARVNSRTTLYKTLKCFIMSAQSRYCWLEGEMVGAVGGTSDQALLTSNSDCTVKLCIEGPPC